MQQMTPVPASQQVQQITQKLTQALVEKIELDAKAKELEQTILALRNVLAGVGLGQQLAVETAPKPACDH